MAEPTYIAQIIEQVNAVTARCGPIFIFGENIDLGSRISGLARGLTVNPAGRIRTVGNCELTHAGVGLGMVLDGGQAALFAKQLDFMLLGLDQFVNTFNIIRASRPRSSWGSFTIFVIVCDQGYQGPQSSFNGAGDFASMANIPVFCLNGAADATHVIANHFAAPGFRIMCLSQRAFGMPALGRAVEARSADDAVFQYGRGDAATIVSYNFSLRDACDLDGRLRAAGAASDVFHVNFVPGMDTSLLIESSRRTGKLIVVDDSKTVTKFGDALVTELHERGVAFQVLPFVRRGCLDAEYGAIDDRFVPDVERALAFVRR